MRVSDVETVVETSFGGKKIRRLSVQESLYCHTLANRQIGWDGGCGKGGHEQSSRIGAAVANASCKLRAETGDRGQQRANYK